MSSSKPSKLHLAMFPGFAFGHLIPYLHLSNSLAAKGHHISFILPRGVQPKLEPDNHYPDLIRFIPVVVPHVEGLPPGVETSADIPHPSMFNLFTIAFDKTRDQVEEILRAIKPDAVFYDLGHWVASLARQIGIKSVGYITASPVSNAHLATKKVTNEMSVEELIQLPPGYPSSKVGFKAEEVDMLLHKTKPFGEGLSFQDRVVIGMEDCDVIAHRTYHEMEGPYCDYLAQYFGKPVLLTGPCFPETKPTQLEEKWANWLSNFEPSSVVYCSFGSQVKLHKEEFQEVLLGFEQSGQPFLIGLSKPEGCLTIEEAFPEGFQERIQGKGLVHSGWMPQELILKHPSVGCFVTHCGYGGMWESFLSDCQIVCIPVSGEQILNARLMVEELKVAVEVEKGENGRVSKENLSKAIKLVMDKDNEAAGLMKKHHANLKEIISNKDLQEQYINKFIQDLQDLVK